MRYNRSPSPQPSPRSSLAERGGRQRRPPLVRSSWCGLRYALLYNGTVFRISGFGLLSDFGLRISGFVFICGRPESVGGIVSQGSAGASPHQQPKRARKGAALVECQWLELCSSVELG